MCFRPTRIFPPVRECLPKRKANGGRLFAGIEVAGILVSDDDGQSWQAANDGLTDPDIHQILPSKKVPGLVVTACGEGVSRSTDRGNHWKKVTPPGDRTYGNALAEDDKGNIYLGITQDRPRTWTRAGRAKTAIFKSPDGANWELLTEKMSGGVMDVCRRAGRRRRVRRDCGRRSRCRDLVRRNPHPCQWIAVHHGDGAGGVKSRVSCFGF